MAEIVRIFSDEQRGPTAMDADGNMFEITNMFDGDDETDDLDEALVVVVKYDEYHWLTLDVSDKTAWAGRLN